MIRRTGKANVEVGEILPFQQKFAVMGGPETEPIRVLETFNDYDTALDYAMAVVTDNTDKVWSALVTKTLAVIWPEVEFQPDEEGKKAA